MRIHPRLIVLDLDGTSLCYEPREQIDGEVLRCLDLLRQHDVVWAINSDRFTREILDMVRTLAPELKPIAILSMQRYVHIKTSDGRYEALARWNRTSTKAHGALWQQIAPSFAAWRRSLGAQVSILDELVNDDVFSVQVPLEQVAATRRLLERLAEPWPDAAVSGNGDWVYLVHRRFSKGALMSELAHQMSIDLDRILAVGDGVNDLSMLDGSLTSQVGCPSSACEEVIAAVTRAGGHVASEPSCAGTLEVIHHYTAHTESRASVPRSNRADP